MDGIGAQRDSSCIRRMNKRMDGQSNLQRLLHASKEAMNKKKHGKCYILFLSALERDGIPGITDCIFYFFQHFFQYFDNGTAMAFPHNITVNGI